MKASERENLRRAILNVAETNGSRFGLPAAAFKLHVSSTYGFPNVTAEEVEAELQYLTEKELVNEVQRILSPENRLWRITAQGRDFLAQGAA